MSSQIGRNDLCPCGSGKKYKNCCQKRGIVFNKKNQNKIAFFVLGGVVLLAGIISISKITSTSSLGSQTPVTQQPLSTPSALPSPIQQGTQSSAGTAFTPQPGPAPAGKVWSPEHGHWHDAPGTIPSTAPNAFPGQTAQSTPQPPGPAPEGKVWSAEHGHWHDAPTTNVITNPNSVQNSTNNSTSSSPVFDIVPGQLEAQTQTPIQGTLTPQPPGPAPAGKVWSPEHGHWHDAPIDARTIQVTPSNTDPK